MDIESIIDGGFVEPSEFSGEIVIPRSLVKKMCEEHGCTDEKLMRLQLGAILNGLRKQQLWDKSGTSADSPKLANFVARVLEETCGSQRYTIYSPDEDGNGAEFSMPAQETFGRSEFKAVNFHKVSM